MDSEHKVVKDYSYTMNSSVVEKNWSPLYQMLVFSGYLSFSHIECTFTLLLEESLLVMYFYVM